VKIACITTSQIPSRTANSIQVMKVCQAFKQCGQEIKLWLPLFRTADWIELKELYGLQEEFSIEWLPFNPLLKQYDFCWRALGSAKKWGADVIYTWALQCAVFAQCNKLPTVMEFHDFPMGILGPHLFRRYIRNQKNSISLTTTAALARGLEQRYHFTFQPGALQIAPNGTEPERYAHLSIPPQARQQLGLMEALTVGFSGHFYEGRGIALLLEIARALPEIQFLWMGGEEKHIQPWREELKKWQIANVTLTGFIPNEKLPLFQAACDMLLMPYEKKIAGSSGGDISKVINPMKMFDYLACGRAIIASDIPVFHEILSEQTALFCPSDDSQAWVAAIQKLARQEEERERLAQNAKALSQQYSWKKRAEKTLSLLDRLEDIRHDKKMA